MANQRRREPGQAPKRPAEKPAPKRPVEEEAFAPAKPINRKKLALQLMTVAAVALAIAIGLSIFFKVDTISITGLDKYQYDTVVEASGIQMGDSLLFFSRAEVSSKIRQALPYVDTVRIGITLPGRVNIIIQEVAVAYAVQDAQDGWWLISASGIVVEQIHAPEQYTQIQGLRLQTPAVGKAAVAEEAVNQDPNKPITVTGNDRLQAALVILQALEKNELLGCFAQVDVTSPYDLRLWYGTSYEFQLGNSQEMTLKLAWVKSALPKILLDYPPGTLDVSNPGDSDRIPFTQFE